MTLLFEMPGGFEWVVIYGTVVLMIIPLIFYLLTLQSTFRAIAPENRAMSPDLVWLQLIPIFGVVWSFIIVNNLDRSIQAEEKARGVQFATKPSRSVGLAMCILKCFFFIPLLNILTGIAAFACWIVYWIAVASFKEKLAMQILTPPAPSL